MQHDHSTMQHDHSAMQNDSKGEHQHGSMNPAGMFLMQQSSGTSMNPLSWRMPMLMGHSGGWSFMGMGQAFLVNTQQSGPRGRDAFYSPNWGMLSAGHSAGRGSFMIQAMVSLEPATVRGRSYPLLFQTGETAYGKPLTDAQHPHDMVMGLGVHYAHPVGESSMFQAYFAPIGDPALGPVAFPHRASAMELPQATLSHHWQDSTHIASDVATVGVLIHSKARVEVSGFHGREPDENRWNIDQGAMDSWSSRLTVFPARNWLAQVSVGRLHRPEALESTDVVRTTASLHYIKPMPSGDWATTFGWGRNHKTAIGRGTNSYLVETMIPASKLNIFTARAELAGKDELFAHGHDGEEQHSEAVADVYRIGALTFGYTRDVPLTRYAQTGIGANFTAYTLPSAIKPMYGDRPFGVSIYLRVRMRSGQ